MRIILLLVCLIAISTAVAAVGGWKEQDPIEFMFNEDNGPAFGAAIQSSIRLIGDDFQLEKVIHVQTQLVAGMNTRYELLFKSSSDPNVTKTVLVKVFSQPWTNTLEVTECQEIQQVNVQVTNQP